MTDSAAYVYGDTYIAPDDRRLVMIGAITYVEFPNEKDVVLLAGFNEQGAPNRVVTASVNLIQTGGKGNILLVDSQGYGHCVTADALENEYAKEGHTDTVPAFRPSEELT